MTITFPDGFLWGTATAAHQVEGGNWNNDWWQFEHTPGTAASEPSGRRVRPLLALPGRHQAARRPRVRRLPVLARVVADRARGGRVVDRSALDHYRRMIAACREHDLVARRHVPPLHDARAGPRRTGAGTTRRSSIGSLASASAPPRTSAPTSASGCTINEPNVVSLIGYRLGDVPSGGQRPRRVRPREREPQGRAPEGVRRDQGRAGRLPLGVLRRDGRLVVARGVREDARRIPAHARGPAPRGARGRRLRRRPGVLAHPAHRAGQADSAPRRASRRSTWATSTGPRRSRSSIRYAAEVDRLPDLRHRERHRHDRRRAAHPLRRRGARRGGPLPRTTGSTSAATSTGRSWTTSSGPSATAPVRARRRRPGDPGAHDQAQRHLAGRRSPGPTGSAELVAPGAARPEKPHTSITTRITESSRL